MLVRTSRPGLLLALNLGIAYLHCGKPGKALKEFEAVLGEKRDQGLALDLAAKCYFLLGNHVEGWRHAKEARQLGNMATYNDGVAGVFRKGSAPRRATNSACCDYSTTK